MFGLVTEALRRRREREIAPFTVMSCDNLQGNGRLARTAFTAFARLRDAELGDWIARERARSPTAMVDRITPATTDEDVEEVRERFGVEDRWPVVCEPFIQWVLEDAFSAGRPPYEDVGVQVVDDVEPYELMKLRLLNASHQALAYFGYLCGYRLVHDAAQDPLFRDLLCALHGRGGDADARAGAGRRPRRVQADADRALLQPGGARHGPAAVRGELRPHPQVAAAGGARAAGGDGEITRSAAIVASWARYAEGVDEDGEPIEIVDRRADRLRELARERGPVAFIGNRELFGDLADDERFASAYRSALRLAARARRARDARGAGRRLSARRRLRRVRAAAARRRPFRTPRRPARRGRPGRGDRAVPLATGTAGWATTRTSARSRTCPGHELAGVIEAVGPDVRELGAGRARDRPVRVRVRRPASSARAGNEQICDRQRQPGFTHWGSFAELVALDWADVNLVALPDGGRTPRRRPGSAAASPPPTARSCRSAARSRASGSRCTAAAASGCRR